MQLSATDVGIYRSDRHAARPLIGNHEDTYVGGPLHDYLSVDADALARKLRSRDEDDGLDRQVAGEESEAEWAGLSEERP